MPLQEVEQLMSHGVEKYTERTTVSFLRMKEELAQVAEQGYAVNDEELLPGYLVIFGQMLGRFSSIELGMNPDSPSANGLISPVVEKFAIYA